MTRPACADVRARLEDFAADALPARERTAVRNHLADCGGCRAEAIAAEPLLRFAAVRPETVSAEETAAILSAVKSAIAVKSAERRVDGARRKGSRRFGAAAAVAALIVFALAISGDRPSRPARSSEPPARAAAPARVAAPFAPAAQPGPAAKFPADATVYDWNPGGGQPRVVWIVDGSLDI
jgi:hypothetical protein